MIKTVRFGTGNLYAAEAKLTIRFVLKPTTMLPWIRQAHHKCNVLSSISLGVHFHLQGLSMLPTMAKFCTEHQHLIVSLSQKLVIMNWLPVIPEILRFMRFWNFWLRLHNIYRTTVNTRFASMVGIQTKTGVYVKTLKQPQHQRRPLLMLTGNSLNLNQHI